MSQYDPDVFESPIITLSVGPSGKKFHIHARFLEMDLASIVGPIKNNSDHIRVRENIEDIFGQVCEYLYSGDYSVGVSKSVGDSEEDGTDHDHCIGQFSAEGQEFPHLKGNTFLNPASVHAKSRSLGWALESAPRHPSCGQRDFTCKHPDTLFLHLRLHVFAKKHGIISLAAISLDKLLNTLGDFPMDTNRINDIVRLFELASASGTNSDLFTMMLHYVSSRLQFLMCRGDLICLLHKRPDLNFELLKYLARSTQAYSSYEPMCKFAPHLIYYS